MSDFNLGTVTAYGYAKDKGYTGTEDEYAELMASYADVAEQAAESAEQAAASATTATAKASEAAQSATSAASSKTAAETAQGGAETAAQTATTKAGEASASATTASGKATEATTAAGTATTKASEATTAATTATTKAGEASTSATNAAASATRAQEILDSIPEDYSQLSDDVSDLKDGLLSVTTGGEESIVDTFGTRLRVTAPWMAQEKYGFKTLIDVTGLSFKTELPLGASCSITFSIKDANGTVYGEPVTQDYTITTAGDIVSVNVSFSFSNLPKGQYYFWMVSSVNSAMGYGYQAAAFPTGNFVELTPDGGWSSTTVGTLTTYRMILLAEITCISKKAIAHVNSKNVYINNESALGALKERGTWTVSDNVLSLNYTGTGNTWFSYYVDMSKVVSNILNVKCEVEISDGSSLVLYVFGVSTSGQTLYNNVGVFREDGNIDFLVDLNNLVIYKSLDLSKPISIGFANYNAPCVATVTDFECLAYETTITEDNVYDALSVMKAQTASNDLRITAISATNGILRSPNGTSYFMSVSDAGIISAIRAVPNKSLFIGNSLLTGNGGFGMNASASDKDYFYYVKNKILDLDSSATFVRQSGTGFEGATTVASANTWMTNTLLPLLSNDLDLVVVQLGDNVNTPEKQEVFTESCGNLITFIRQNAPNARVAWVGEWYSTTARQQTIANACIAKGATFVDISALATTANKSYIGAIIHKTSQSTTTYTIDSYTDDATNHVLTVQFTVSGNQYSAELPYDSYTVDGSALTVVSEYIITTSSGVASHPGDSGMIAVADAIINALGL